jgi:hypothetical protein
MEEVIEGAHPRSNPRFGLPGNESGRSKKQPRTEGQIGANLAGGIEIEVPAGTACYGSFDDIRWSGNPRAKGPQTFEEKGIKLLPSSSSIDEHGEHKPTIIGGKPYIEVIVGTKLGEEGAEIPDTIVIPYNDPLRVNGKKIGKRIFNHT